MVSDNILLTNIVLVLFAIIFSAIGIYYYHKGYKRFLKGDFKTYATWMFVGVIIYAVHLFSHLLVESIEIGWMPESLETFAALSLYILLAIAGAFFLVGGYYYLKLAKVYGFKK